MGKIFVGYWDCPYCGTNDIAGDVYDCPNCGKARDDDIVFHPNPHSGNHQPRRYVSPNSDAYRRATAGPDWTCSYCDSNNPANIQVCRKCGHSKDESDKNYFEHHPERHNVIIPVSHEAGDDQIRKNDDDDDDDDSYPLSISPPTSIKPYNRHQQSRRRRIDFPLRDIDTPRISPPRKEVSIFAIIAIIFIGIIFLLVPKERTITVTDIDWERSIAVEEYRTVRESDWYVPSGGRVVYTQSEIHHYDHVLDHYESVTKTRQVITGSHEEVVGYRDLGNGHFEEITRTVYDYGTETYTEMEPRYVDVPVYQTKYYYDIERWVYDHTVTAKAHDKEPYWPEVTLAQNQREGGQRETYGLSAIYKDKESHYVLDYDPWRYVSIGDELHVKVHVTGYIEILDE